MSNLNGGPGRPLGTVNGMRTTPPLNLQKLNHRHEAMINWLLANPDKPLTECARFFNYTPTHVYTVVNSDMFQMVYRQRAEELGVIVVHGMKERLTGAANMLLDTMQQKVMRGEASETYLTNATKTVLDALGYSGKSREAVAPAQTNVNVTVVSRQDLEAAREAARKRFPPPDTSTVEARAEVVA